MTNGIFGGYEIDKRINLALIFAIGVQSILFAVAWGKMDQRVSNLETIASARATLDPRVSRLEESISMLVRTTTRTEDKLDRLIERQQK